MNAYLVIEQTVRESAAPLRNGSLPPPSSQFFVTFVMQYGEQEEKRENRVHQVRSLSTARRARQGMEKILFKIKTARGVC